MFFIARVLYFPLFLLRMLRKKLSFLKKYILFFYIKYVLNNHIHTSIQKEFNNNNTSISNEIKCFSLELYLFSYIQIWSYKKKFIQNIFMIIFFLYLIIFTSHFCFNHNGFLLHLFVQFNKEPLIKLCDRNIKKINNKKL